MLAAGCTGTGSGLGWAAGAAWGCEGRGRAVAGRGPGWNCEAMVFAVPVEGTGLCRSTMRGAVACTCCGAAVDVGAFS